VLFQVACRGAPRNSTLAPKTTVPSDHGRISFEWTAAHHFAAVDYLRSRSKRGPLFKAGMLILGLLAALTIVGFNEGGLSHKSAVHVLSFFAAFTVLGAIAWAAFTSPRVRRFLFRRSSALPCALEFDKQGITVAIGKSPLRYPWTKVRSIGESADYMFVLASSSACFAIPKSAFGSPLEAEYFAATMRSYLGP
jgi:hypothetical protein